MNRETSRKLRDIEIIRLYRDERIPQADIMSQFNIGYRTFLGILKLYNVPRNKPVLRTNRIFSEVEQEIVQAYLDGVPCKEIYKSFEGLDRHHLVKILARNQITRNRRKDYDYESWTDEEKTQFLEDYQNAMPLQEIQKKYNFPNYVAFRRFLLYLGYMPSRVTHELSEQGTFFDCRGRRVIKKRHLKKHWEIDVDMMKFFR